MTLVSIIGLYQEQLLQGSYRGIGFAFEKNNDDIAGRRTQAFMFPGQDITAFQDLGQFDGDIEVRGILSGDDFTHQIDRLRTAFQTAGPGTLVHFALGTLQVIQVPERAPKFLFVSEELRIARFVATFRRYTPRPKPQADTLQALMDRLADMRTAAYGMLANLLAPVALTLTALGQVESLAGEVATALASLILSCPDPLVGLGGNLPIGLLSSVNSTPFDSHYAASVGALLAGPTAAIAGTSTPAVPAAVATGGTTSTAPPVDGRITAALILSASSRIGAATLTNAPIALPPGPGLILSTQMFMLADATRAASAISFVSQQEASTWRDQINAAYDAAILAAAALAPSAPAPGAALWRAGIAAKSAWIADMNATIGRLPAVELFTPPGPSSVWLIAQYLAGDDPSTLFATWRDIVARNAIAHPAMPPSGALEVLSTGLSVTTGPSHAPPSLIL